MDTVLAGAHDTGTCLQSLLLTSHSLVTAYMSLKCCQNVSELLPTCWWCQPVNGVRTLKWALHQRAHHNLRLNVCPLSQISYSFPTNSYICSLGMGPPSKDTWECWDTIRTLVVFLEEQLKKGYIVPSISPYTSPFFFVKKKDSKLQPVQDYRKLNKYTIWNCYPLPFIPNLISQV